MTKISKKFALALSSLVILLMTSCSVEFREKTSSVYHYSEDRVLVGEIIADKSGEVVREIVYDSTGSPYASGEYKDGKPWIGLFLIVDREEMEAKFYHYDEGKRMYPFDFRSGKMEERIKQVVFDEVYRHYPENARFREE